MALMKAALELPRCPRAGNDAVLAWYHDEEWGAPVQRDAAHFERLSLEVFQAGLSWRIILHKRPALRRAFARFSPVRVATFTRKDVHRLLSDPGIVPHRGKIEATIQNATKFLALLEAHGKFARYLDSLPGDLETLRKTIRSKFAFMGPKIAASHFESVGKIPILHHPKCWKAKTVTSQRKT